MGAIPSKDSRQPLISATNVIGDTITTTLNIIRARGNGVNCVNECPNFIAAKQARGRGNYPVPQELCRLCHWEFDGTHCYNYHLQ